jgi:hypothetical protein
MLVAIRNATGIDLHLAISASERIRVRVTLDPPVLKEGEETTPLRAGHAFGLTECPEGIGVRIVRGGLSIRVVKQRSVIDKLDDFGEKDGEELYLDITLFLLN